MHSAYAYLRVAALDMANPTNAHNDSTPALNTHTDSTKGALGHSRGKSLANCGFNVDYDTKEVERLAQEIRDGTVAEILLELFVQWISQDDRNYVEAKKYIRELAVDQDYPLSRIANESVRKLVEDCYELRPEYKAPITNERENTVGLLEILQESAIKPSTPKNKLRSRVSLPSSLRRPSLPLPTHSPSWKEESPIKEAEEESIMFTSHLISPISSPLTPREAGSFPKLKKMLSVAASISSPSVVTAPRSRSQQYPPDTPDRPAPLTVVKSKTHSTLKSGTVPSVSTPSRTRWVVPLPPDGDSPPPSVPAIPSSSQFTPSSKPKPKPKYSLIPPRYARQPRHENPSSSQDDDYATIVGSLTTAATKSPDSPAPTVTNPLTSSAASSGYSDTDEPKRFSVMGDDGVTDSRHDTPSVDDRTPKAPRRASEYTSTSDDWYTIAHDVSELEVTARPTSLYDSFGFLKEELYPQEEGDPVSTTIESTPDTLTQSSPRPPRVDSLSKMPRIPRLSKVPPEKRAAAKLARQEAIDGNEIWMRTFDDLPLRRFVSIFEVGSPRTRAPHPPTHTPAPILVSEELEEDDDGVAVEERERLFSL
ncbi:hypothetical protein DPSP01_009300 [Paraphaeosphaeria sporulosa]